MRLSTTASALWRGATKNGVRLYTRNGYDFAGRFPQIVEGS
jgi:ATP-dependent DNA ligase